ncbi:DNA polymerase III gamma/tau subunit [Stanieria sp. NIES-3757]|nr:DNA polymerase III gamma/tau subunit [Stanieria sp. NIES-3757]
MAYEPLHHKYRPQKFADLVGQSAIAHTLINAINQKKIAPAYLFTGPRGTGKTSSARILAKSLNCLNSDRPTPNPCGKCEVCCAIAHGTALDVIEIDAASNTGVDNIREVIERAQFAPVQCRYKVYVIDECHMLSTAAFNALLKTLEEPPRNVIFILATTDPQRVLSTIISRCQRFDYRRIPLEEMVAHLRYIAREEAIDITEDALILVAQIANGGLRDAESLLDQLSLLPETITVEKIWDLVGAVPEQDLLALLQAIRENNPEQILQKCRNLLDRGREPIIVLQNLAGFYLNLLIAKTAAHRSDLVAVTETTWQKLIQEAKNWEINLILRGQQQLKEGESQLKHTTQPRLWLEIILLGLLQSSQTVELSDNARVSNDSLPIAKVIQSASVTEKVLVNRDRENSVNQTKTQSVALPQEVSSAANNTISISQTLPQESTTAASITQENNQISSPEKSEPPTTNLVEEDRVNHTEDSQKIWLQAIQLIQPPTTQALLIQQCYLIKIEASVVAIAISSSSLSKLLQNKVSNIESAFSKVCQRKMKVHFEVNPLNKAEKKKLDHNSKEFLTENSQSDLAEDEQRSEGFTPFGRDREVELHSSDPEPTISSTVTVSPQLPQTIAIAEPKSEHFNDAASLPKESKTDLDREHLKQFTSFLPNSNHNAIERSPSENLPEDQAVLQQNNFNSEADFQKAIDIFIKNFEGEIAVLSDYDSETKDEEETTIITPEYQSNSSSELIDRTKIINHPLKDHLKLTGDRPDLNDYEDDDDIPF